jgi:antirestriction protein ArdC
MNQTKTDVYAQITNAIVAAIEEGAQKYEMPWHTRSTPVNAISHKAYRGVNVLMLWAAAKQRGYSAHEWATYRQWQEAGAQVRKGERSTTVVFWKFCDRSEEQQEDSDFTPDRPRCFARLYNVFNAAQVDGYTSAAIPQLSPAERIENADRFFASLPGVVRHGGDRAYYSPAGDFIQMPPFAQFKSAAGYASTLGHEYAHWSGAPSRLNRDLSGRFGDERYSAEERNFQPRSCAPIFKSNLNHASIMLRTWPRGYEWSGPTRGPSSPPPAKPRKLSVISSSSPQLLRNAPHKRRSGDWPDSRRGARGQ